ncbi:MAG: Orthopoxvirus protein of unknown function [Eubacterium sp.]|nr:Orthopoxvirus protein of unknown function [Eubacterium sp.]
MRKPGTKLKFFISLITLFINLYCFFIIANNYNTVYYPLSPRIDITHVLENKFLSTSDYSLLLKQTGLGRPAVDELLSQAGGKAKLISFQNSFYTRNNMYSEKLNPFTSQETLILNDSDNTNQSGMVPLQNGDILFTKSAQTLFWRHGHCGIVIDAEKGITLESLHPGTISMKQDISKWMYYPTLKIMRLKSPGSEKINEIVKYSEKNLLGLTYKILARKCYDDLTPVSENCSLLVWQAFNRFGYDLDSNKGIFVTPRDIAKSPLLETVQVKGFDPDKGW